MKNFFLKIAKFLDKVISKFFAKKTILIITENRSFAINFYKSHQIILTLIAVSLFYFAGEIFGETAKISSQMSHKNSEIENLQAVNSYFKSELKNLNAKLNKIDEYLALSSAKEGQELSKNKGEKSKILNLLQNITNQKEKESLQDISQINQTMNRIEEKITNRSLQIQEAIKMTGLNLKQIPTAQSSYKKTEKIKEISLNDPKDLLKKQGGPLLQEDENLQSFSRFDQEKISFALENEKKDFDNKIKHLIALEKISHQMPFEKPMKNYYISSGFGVRYDPITGSVANHQGLDFVGPKGEKIFAVADGVVSMAEKFSDYGNAVDIEHGLGISTRYAHLSKIFVERGQKIKKGQLIASQGSTGRSTGEHLHYEVRYKNNPLNPKKFLEAGEIIKQHSSQKKPEKISKNQLKS